jgi:hypothetical protein
VAFDTKRLKPFIGAADCERYNVLRDAIAEIDILRARVAELEPMDDSAPLPMTDAQIKHMVDRFLGWKLPADFNPDCGIHFDDEAAKNLNPINSRYEPSGTNVFDAQQATAMVRFMIEGLSATLSKVKSETDIVQEMQLQASLPSSFRSADAVDAALVAGASEIERLRRMLAHIADQTYDASYCAEDFARLALDPKFDEGDVGVSELSKLRK